MTVADFFRKIFRLTRSRSYAARDEDFDRPRRETAALTGMVLPTCEHEKRPGYVVVTVLGHEVIVKNARLCQVCLEDYLDRHSTRCAACAGPILPGEPVGQAWRGAKFPFTHLTDGCCESGGLFCGRWGEGRLITLHELNPGKYPPGTTSVMAHAFISGGTVVVSDADNDP